MSVIEESAAATSETACAECDETQATQDESVCPNCGTAFAAETVELSPDSVEVSVDGVEVPAELGTRPDDAEPGEQLATVIVVDNDEDEIAEEADEPSEEASALPTWEGELAYQGLATSDGRVLMAGQITHRDLPLSLMFQYVTAEGHMGAEACGKITQIWEEPRPDMGEGVVAIMGSGEFSTDMMGPTAAASVGDQIVRHVSVDIAPTSRVVLNAQTLQEVPAEDLDYDAVLAGEYLVGVCGEIMGATIVPFSAFADAKLRTISSDEVVLASAWNTSEEGVERLTFVTSNGSFKLIPVSLTAAAAGLAPLAPPKDWFFSPEPEGKFPLTVMDDGRIMGHLATWDQCHHGFMNECVLAQPSRTNYSFFHVGSLMTAEGDYVDVGRIVVGETTASGHASVQYRAAEASKHYDKCALVGAFVRAVDGQYGIWLSGVVRSDCPAERVRDMLANPPSGDWRAENGHLELIAALSVPVPGFPVPRYEYALTASAEEVEVTTLIATGYFELDPPPVSRSEIRKREVLLSQARDLVKK